MKYINWSLQPRTFALGHIPF